MSRILAWICFAFDVVIVVSFVLGMFFPPLVRLLFWSAPAGYAVVVIWCRWFLKPRQEDGLGMEFGIGDKKLKMFDSRDDNVPPEIREKMNEITKILKEKGMIPEGEKCADPHCENCYGLGKDEE